MTQNDFYIWKAEYGQNRSIANEIINVPRNIIIQFRPGACLADVFPDSVGIQLSKERLDADQLPDNVRNNLDLIIVSERLKSYLVDNKLDHVEYLPVSLQDSRGETLVSNYFIVHCVDHVNCLDVKASGGEWDEMDESLIGYVDQVVLDLDRVDPERALFRPAPLHYVTVITKALADELDARAFTGLRWMRLEDCSI